MFKTEYKFTSAYMATLIKEAKDEFLISKLVKRGKNWPLLEHMAHVFSNFIKEKWIVSFERSMHFNVVTFKTLKMAWERSLEDNKIKNKRSFPVQHYRL